MKWFLEEVAPLLHHAGVDVYSRQWPFGSAPKGVRYRADQPDFAEYGIFIAPIRSGSGMRIKLLEAMARGKAIVTTPLGAEGLNAIHGTHLLLADSPSEFAAAMDELHQSAELRTKLGSAAANHARMHFSDQRAAEGIARELATFAP
jgi:glycosyltransferase involved in cell wall biosynthesis